MKKILTFFFASVVLFGYFARSVRADGLIVPPEPYPVFETGQKALMIYDGGVEDLVLSVSFKGDASEFGWIIPTPNKPEVSKVDTSVFRRLEDFTDPKQTLLEKLKDATPSINYYAGVDTVKESAANQENALEVEVIEEDTLGMYDYAVLKANKVEDLKTWMDEHGFVLPTSHENKYPNDYMWQDTDLDSQTNEKAWSEALPIFQSYIDSGWYLVTVKINNSFVDFSGVEKQLSDGNISPLRLRFETTDIVFPMKLTALGRQSLRVETYVVAEKKIELENYKNANFTTFYAGKMKKEDINDVTKQVGKGSWYEAEKDFIITKIVNNSLSYTKMNEELIFTEAEDQKGVKDGSMKIGEWLQVPIVIILSIPVFILGGMFTVFDGGYLDLWGIDSVWFMIITSLLSLLSLIWVVMSNKVLRKTKKKFLRILVYVTQFASLWLVSLEVGILFGVPIGFLIYQMDLNEIFVLNAVCVMTLTMMAIPVLYYRRLWKK